MLGNFHAHIARIFVSLKIYQALGLLLLSVAACTAADTPQPASVSTSQIRNADVTTWTRPNGCILEFWRYPKFKQTFWIQNVKIGEETLVRIQYSAEPKDHSFVVRPSEEYSVAQLDNDLDGKYEMLIVVSEKKQAIVDVLMLADEGWLRHGTVEEFQARLLLAEGMRQSLKDIETGINKLKKEFER